MKDKFSKFINLQGKYLTSLLILLAMSIGNVWGADLQYFSSITASSTKNSFAISNVSAASAAGGTATFTMATGTSSAAKYYVNMVPQSTDNLKLQLFNGINNNFEDTIYLCVTVNADTYLSFCRGSNPNYAVIGKKNNSTNVFSYESNDAMVKETGSYLFKSGYTYYIKSSTTTGNSVNEVRVYHKDASTTVTITACLVEGHPAAGSPATTYSITVNPDGGTTSTEGWTLTSGNYVKSGIAKDASVTLPTMTKDDYTFAGWKDNHDNAITSPITITKDTTLVAQWTSSAATQSNITYTNTKGADNSNPAKYYEGTGVTSFEALADVTGFHFTGWDPASIGTTATGAQTITAQWVAAYDVTFSAGAGSGTVPATFQKWEGAKFNLPGQGEMTAPAGKAFDGWKANGAGDKLAANAEYTMGNAAVEFVAQWKAVPIVLFHYQQSNLSGNLAAGTYDAIGGTLTTSAAMSKESAAYNAAVPNDLKGGANVSKLGSNAAYIQLTLTTGNFKEGDTVYICGYNPYKISSTTELTADIAASITTGTAKTDYNIGYAIIPEGIEQGSIYLSRAAGNGTGFAAVKVIRPAARDILSTVISLSDLKVNDHSISSDSLAILKTADAYALTLGDEFAEAPVIKFNEHTVITYVEGEPATKVTDKVYTVTATVNGEGKWQAQQAIAGTTYIVTAPKAVVVPGHNVIYNGNGNDGGSVPVDADKHVADVEVTVLGNTGSLTKTIGGEPAVFHGWNTNSDMVGGTHYEAGDKFTMPDAEVNLYAVWGFAINYNLDGGTINDATYATWYVSTGTETSISTPLPSNVTREGYTFDGWYTHNGIGNKVTSINAEYTGNFAGEWALKAKWILTAPIGKAQSIDMEGLVESDGTGAEWQNYLYSHGYSFSTENVSLDEKKDPSENKAYDNWPYQGLKMKKTGSYVQGTVEADKLVIIKLGHMAAAATVTIGGVAQANATGLDAAEPAGKYNYYYVASESVLRYETNSNDACVLKAITITAPYTVSFDVNGGDAAIASMTGTPSIILPTPTKGTETFLGWFVGENKIGEAGALYTPTADVELVAHWEAISTDARLSAIEITPNTGVLAPAFNMELTEYTYTMPYGTGAVPQITGATPNHEGASYGYLVQAENWGDVAEVRGIALSTDTKKYQITMVQGPKDGVEIISIAVKNGNGNAQTIAAEDISGFIGGTATQKLQSGGTKLGGNGNYIGFTLANSETLKAGDVIRLNVSATNGAGHLTLYQGASDANLVKDITWTATEGVNLIPVPAEAVGLNTLYIYRTSSACNPSLSEFAILRPMNPVMTAITIDGRAGVIDEANKTVEVTIPYEADLAALTVEPTIFWNGAGSADPLAAWVIDENTYRITDKDGDYTDYTITLTRDVQKFTVSYNTHEGSAVEPELVVAGEKLAAAPAAPTKEDYIFQGWSLSENGAIIDITDITIDENKTFHAVWLYENPIKLIDNHAINNDDFITGVTLGNVTIGSEQVECFEFAGGLSDFINIKDKNRVVVYNATTNKTKIKVTMYNNKSSALTYYIKGVVEGSSDVVDIATVEVASGETKTSGYYEFNSDEAKNRSIYVYVETSAGNMHFLQVKVIDNGETPVKKVGEIGYSLNLNKGRLFGRSSTELDFEGIHFDNSADYQPTSSTALKLANKSISFDVTEIVKMSVTTNNNKTYYVTRGAAGTSNETAKTGTTDFTLIPGKWFITAGSSNVEITNIAFSEATPDYTRENLNPAYLGTLCWTNDAVLTGGTLYEFAGKNENNYLAFDEVEENLLVAGKPYIFMPENGNTEIKVYNINNVKLTEDQDPVNNMYGTITGKTLTQGADDNMYYFSANHIWAVKDFTVAIPIPAYCCYVDYPAVLASEPAAAPAPGRRRVTMGVKGEQVVTDIENIEASEKPMKVMINGQIFIIRGEKMFGIDGKLIK